nr:hypothetical protein [Pseudoroseomonas cervicalis]
MRDGDAQAGEGRLPQRRQRLPRRAQAERGIVGGARAAAEQVAEAARGDGIGDGAELEIGHAGQLRRLGGGEGERRGGGAEQRHHALHPRQAAHRLAGLGGVIGLGLDQAQRAAEQPARLVARLHRQLQPAEALIAGQGERAGGGVDGADAQLIAAGALLRRGRMRGGEEGGAQQQAAPCGGAGRRAAAGLLHHRDMLVLGLTEGGRAPTLRANLPQPRRQGNDPHDRPAAADELYRAWHGRRARGAGAADRPAAGAARG